MKQFPWQKYYSLIAIGAYVVLGGLLNSILVVSNSRVGALSGLFIGWIGFSLIRSGLYKTAWFYKLAAALGVTAISVGFSFIACKIEGLSTCNENLFLIGSIPGIVIVLEIMVEILLAITTKFFPK